MYFKEFIVRPEIVDVNSDEPVFFFFSFSLKQVNTVVAVTLNQNCAFLMLYKTLMFGHLI